MFRGLSDLPVLRVCKAFRAYRVYREPPAPQVLQEPWAPPAQRVPPALREYKAFRASLDLPVLKAYKV